MLEESLIREDYVELSSCAIITPLDTVTDFGCVVDGGIVEGDEFIIALFALTTLPAIVVLEMRWTCQPLRSGL